MRWGVGLLKCVKYILGGGKLKYRVRGNWVEMKGGGMGFWWGPAALSSCDTHEQAIAFARRWAKNEGGIFLENYARDL